MLKLNRSSVILVLALLVTSTGCSRSGEPTIDDSVPIEFDQPIKGELTEAEPTKLFKIVVAEPTEVSLDVQSDHFSGVAKAYGKNLKTALVGPFARKSGRGYSYSPGPYRGDLDAGTFYIKVTSGKRGSYGPFTLTCGKPPVVQTKIGETVTGELNASRQSYRYEFVLDEPSEIDIQLKAPVLPVLELYKAPYKGMTDRPLHRGRNVGNEDVRIVENLEPGQYIIKVTSVRDGIIDPFSLTTSRAQP